MTLNKICAWNVCRAKQRSAMFDNLAVVFGCPSKAACYDGSKGKCFIWILGHGIWAPQPPPKKKTTPWRQKRKKKGDFKTTLDCTITLLFFASSLHVVMKADKIKPKRARGGEGGTIRFWRYIISSRTVPAGSPLLGGDVSVSVFWRKPTRRALPFTFCSWGLLLSLRLFWTCVSFLHFFVSYNLIPSYWLGPKHQLTL